MPRMEEWELLGLLLVAGGAIFGVAYGVPGMTTLSLTNRAVGFHLDAEAAMGLSALVLAALTSFAAIVVGYLKPAGNNIGATIIIWTDFVVLLVGDVLFYLGYLDAPIILLVGLASAVLTMIGLGVIVRRPLRVGQTPS